MDLYSSKFQPRSFEHLEDKRKALPNQTSGGAASSDKNKFGWTRIGNAHLRGEGWRQALPNMLEHREFARATVQKARERRFGR